MRGRCPGVGEGVLRARGPQGDHGGQQNASGPRCAVRGSSAVPAAPPGPQAMSFASPTPGGGSHRRKGRLGTGLRRPACVPGKMQGWESGLLALPGRTLQARTLDGRPLPPRVLNSTQCDECLCKSTGKLKISQASPGFLHVTLSLLLSLP